MQCAQNRIRTSLSSAALVSWFVQPGRRLGFMEASVAARSRGTVEREGWRPWAPMRQGFVAAATLMWILKGLGSSSGQPGHHTHSTK